MNLPHFLVRWTLPVVTIATLVVVTTIPMSSSVGAIPGFDKAAHLLYMGLVSTVLIRVTNLWLVIAVGVGTSIATELWQYFIPWRDCSVMDAVFGIAGTLLATCLYRTRWYRAFVEFKLW